MPGEGMNERVHGPRQPRPLWIFRFTRYHPEFLATRPDRRSGRAFRGVSDAARPLLPVAFFPRKSTRVIHATL